MGPTRKWGKLSTIEELPDEMLTSIVQYLQPTENQLWNERTEKPWKHLLAVSLVSRRMNRIATDPKMWAKFGINNHIFTIEATLKQVKMPRMATLKKLRHFWFLGDQKPAQMQTMLERYASRHKVDEDSFNAWKRADFSSLDPELVVKVVAGCRAVKISGHKQGVGAGISDYHLFPPNPEANPDANPDANEWTDQVKFTPQQINMILIRIAEGDSKVRSLYLRDGSGEILNVAQPSLLAKALSFIPSVTIENASADCRLSTAHLVAIFNQIAEDQNMLENFSYVLPGFSFHNHSPYPRLRGLPKEMAKTVLAKVIPLTMSSSFYVF